MSTLSHKLVAVSLVAAFSMVMYGCGGGGSSGPADDMMTGGGDPATCPDGQVGMPPDCMDPEPPGPTAEEIAAATKAAGTKKTAIAMEAAQTADAADADAGLGGTGAPAAGALGAYTLGIEYGETSITVEGATDEDDETFELANDFGDGRTMHTRTMEATSDGDVVVEVAIVSTDIEAPVATDFAMVHDLDVNTDTTNDNPDPTFEALEVDQTDADAVALVMSSAFAAGTAAQLTFDSDDDTTADMDEAFETSGTYDGAMGTYKCSGGTDCTVTLNAMGMITEMSEGWIFTPDDGATSDVPDGDYLHYGFWLQRTTDKDDVLTYDEVETFAGSSIDASGSVALVRGTATYTGGALGVYVHSISNPDGTEASATSGHFTADVALTATFAQTNATDTGGADQIPPNMLNSLSGTINNFMLSGHDEGPGWSVSMEQGEIETGDGTASGMTKGGGADGNYEATFHGPTVDADNAPIHPHTVVGEFNANFSNGSVAGGFGARKE